MAKVKKKNNRWIVDYRIGGIRKFPSFETRSEAEAFKRSLLLRPIDRITEFQEVNDFKLAEAIDRYLNQVTPTKAPRTWDVDRRALDSLQKHFEGKHLNEISLMELEAYQLKKSKELSAASVNRYFNVIRHFFKKCEDWNFIKEKPTRRLVNLKFQSPPKRLWLKEEVEEFFSRAPEWLHDIVFFIYETGVRRGEAVNLMWKDVDFDKNAIRVKSIKGGVARERQIPMTTAMRGWFLQKKNTQPLLSKPNCKVFLDDFNLELKSTRVSTGVSRIVKRMGCEGLGLHGMRHTLLTELVQSDVSLEKVRQLAGHSNLRTTEQYLHLKLDDTRSVLENLNEKRDIFRSKFKGS